MTKEDKKNGAHYIDNKVFLQEITKYRNLVQAHKAKGDDDTFKPKVPNYLGECFLKIANHLAYKSNFINYTYRDEMILDGIENCITYIDNFDPAKSSNPFAYFTQITYYAFVRRIQKEKKQQDTKKRYIRNLDIHEIITQEGDDSEYANEFINYLKKQIDDSAPDPVATGEPIAKIIKRRPKYFNKIAEEKITLDID
jgi:hypothetical protein